GVAPDSQKLFDGPVESAESCEQRYNSTTALQSLYLLNNEFVVARATSLAQRLQQPPANQDRRSQIKAAFLAVLGREPDADESQAGETFFATFAANAEVPTTEQEPPTSVEAIDAALVAFCQTLLNLTEFLYLE